MKMYRSGAFQLSSTTKTMASSKQAAHLNFSSKTHEHDVEATRRLIAHQHLKHTPEQRKTISTELDDADLRSLESAGFQQEEDKTTLEDLIRTADLRDNFVLVDGRLVQHKKPENILNLIRRERSVYSQLESGVVRRKKKGQRGWKEPLEVSYCRLPPWYARVVNNSHEEDFKKAVLQFVEDFKKTTGRDVVSVHIHKESEHDLHVHIVHSTVVEMKVEKHMNKGQMKTWLIEQKKHIKELLARDGQPHGPRNVLSYLEANPVAPPVSETVEFLKLRGVGNATPDWPARRRHMAHLGITYRHKAHLYNAALTDETREAVRMTKETDFSINFTSRFVDAEDSAEDDYIDYWMERQLMRRVDEFLTMEEKNKIRSLGHIAAENYVEYGKSCITEGEKKLHDARNELAGLAEQAKKVKADISSRNEALEQKKRILGSREEALNRRSSQLDEKGERLEARQKELDSREESLNQKASSIKQNDMDRNAKAAERERVVEARENETTAKEAKLTLAHKNLIKDWKLAAVTFLHPVMGMKRMKVPLVDDKGSHKKDASGKPAMRLESDEELKKRTLRIFDRQRKAIAELVKMKDSIEALPSNKAFITHVKAIEGGGAISKILAIVKELHTHMESFQESKDKCPGCGKTLSACDCQKK